MHILYLNITIPIRSKQRCTWEFITGTFVGHLCFSMAIFMNFLPFRIAGKKSPRCSEKNPNGATDPTCPPHGSPCTVDILEVLY